MQKIRTRRFRAALWVVSGFSALWLFVITVFGKQLSPQYFSFLAAVVFVVFALAAASFLAICFAPYFHGDRRWFTIPALLTGLFFVSIVLLWQLPLPLEAVV